MDGYVTFKRCKGHRTSTTKNLHGGPLTMTTSPMPEYTYFVRGSITIRALFGWFGFNQNSKYVVDSTQAKQLKPNK